MSIKTIESLEQVLANTYSLYLKTQNYHWNVTGPNFKALHELFGAQYESIIPAIDEIAERIRALGKKVDGSYTNFDKLTKFSIPNKDLKSEEMVKDLVKSNKILIDIIKKSVSIAQKDQDDASADILIVRIEEHQKMLWMLESSL